MPPRSRIEQLYLHQVRISTDSVLQFDYAARRGLSVWKWPINGAGERVTPSALSDHRLSHKFLGPCCICPAFTQGHGFTEAAIVVLTTGQRSGQYVAQCAQRICGYIVYIEEFYSRFGVPVQVYPCRNDDEPRPPPITVSDRTSRDSGTPQRPHGTIGLPIPSPRRLRTGINRRCSEAVVMLSQLNSYIRPGLSERDFRALFVKCVCGLIMTRKSFKYHYCVDDGLRDRAEPEIIEITDSDD